MNQNIFTQKFHLAQLSTRILLRSEPLGIGLHNQCWAGLAIEIAKQKNCLATDYYGLTSKQIKTAVKINNRTPAEMRNQKMFGKTLMMLFSPNRLGAHAQHPAHRHTHPLPA